MQGESLTHAREVYLSEVKRCKPYYMGLLGELKAGLAGDPRLTAEEIKRMRSKLRELEGISTIYDEIYYCSPTLMHFDYKLDEAEESLREEQTESSHSKVAVFKSRVHALHPETFIAEDDDQDYDMGAIGLLERALLGFYDSDFEEKVKYEWIGQTLDECDNVENCENYAHAVETFKELQVLANSLIEIRRSFGPLFY